MRTKEFAENVVKAQYQAPAVEIIEVEVEKGFAVSDPNFGTDNDAK